MDSDAKVIEDRNAAQRVASKFNRLVVSEANRRALHSMMPAATPRQLVPLFQHRTTERTIKAWMRGERFMPQWAIDILDAHGAMIQARAAEVPRGPGQSAGWRNVKGYQLNMRR